MTAEARRFLELLDEPDALFGFRTFGDDKAQPRPELIVNRFGRFDDVADELERLNRRGAGVFVTVNKLDGRGYSEEHVIGIRALFVDLDEDGEAALARVRAEAPTPTAVVESSPGKYHVYWRPSSDVSPDRFRALQVELVERYGSDPKVKDPPRVMRLPGFAHVKGEPKPTRLIEENPEARADVDAWLGRVTERKSPTATQVASTLGSGERNAGLASLAGSLRRRGSSLETIEAALLAENNVRCQPPLPEHEVRQIARSLSRKKPSADLGDFSRDQHGKPHKDSQDNVRLALARLDVAVSYDEFADRLLVQRGDDPPRPLDDEELVRLWLDTDSAFGFRPTRQFFDAVVADAARRARFHPVRAYLDGLEWDGIRRLHRWLVDYLGGDDSAYTRAVGSLVLVAAVRRVRRPGSKFDEMLVLESPQGGLKSSALEALVPDASWFTDDLPLGVGSKELIERTTGRWIIEAADLSGMRKIDVERLKATLSRRVDVARLAYGRLPSERPRHFVVVGTTNDATYLKDSTGGRRFWPVAVGSVKLAELRKVRDQLWAEAAAWEAAGRPVRLDRKLWAKAGQEQEERRVPDPWEGPLRSALASVSEGKLPAERLWEVLGLDVGRLEQGHEQRVTAVMARLGWQRQRLRWGSDRVSCYAKGTAQGRKLSELRVDAELDDRGRVRRVSVIPETSVPF